MKRFIVLATLGLLLAGGLAVGLYMRATGSQASAAEAADPNAPDDGTGSVERASKDDGKGENGEKKKTPVPVNVVAISTGPVSSYITATTNLISENEVKVLAEAEGRIADLLVEEGDRVRKGQTLAVLVRDDAEIALKKAELKATNATLAYERGVRAVEEDLLSREDFDKLKMDDELARQEQAEAQWRLEKTTIRAPFAGRITERIIRPGSHVRSPDHLFTVADFDPLIAYIYLPEKDVFGLTAGRDVRIRVKASEKTSFRGRIRQISPVVDTATGTVKVTVEAVAPPPEVRPGSFVTIEVVRETHPVAVLLPREAVIRELQEAYIFVANGEVAERRVVSLGIEEGGRVEALSGVEPGEQVIVAGQGGLKDGSPIKILPTTEASDLTIASDRDPRG